MAQFRLNYLRKKDDNHDDKDDDVELSVYT